MMNVSLTIVATKAKMAESHSSDDSARAVPMAAASLLAACAALASSSSLNAALSRRSNQAPCSSGESKSYSSDS